MNKLKPCPFCGGNNIVIESCAGLEECENFEECCNPGYFAAVCDYNNGGCGASGGYRKGKEKAIEAWNRRVNQNE